MTEGAEDLIAGLNQLGANHPDLAAALARVFAAVAVEAARSARFARSLEKALTPPSGDLGGDSASQGTGRRRPANRRPPASLDPFTVYADAGEPGLRARLEELDLDRLRDIVSEYGMDNDRLAMRWKDPQRVVQRIVDRVASRASKGSAFQR